jgi:hypothetical protein
MRHITHILRRAAVLACHLVFICLLSSRLGITDADGAETAAPASGPPNILFFIMDDVGIDQMQIFGYGGETPPDAEHRCHRARRRALPQYLGHARVFAEPRHVLRGALPAADQRAQRDPRFGSSELPGLAL